MFLLDTNVLSELRRPHRAHPKVAAWVRDARGSDLHISVINLLELEIGALSIGRRDQAQGAILRAWIDHQVLPAFHGRILPVDTEIALRCAHLHVPDPRSERDALIAATALVHRMKVVTRNVKDFAPMGVEVFNPWES
jgi:predicted nucleic acid-binding protein